MSDIKVPYILTCKVTGIQKSYTSVPFVKRKIENYGGDEAAMINGYVCKDAKRLLKGRDLSTLTVADVQAIITELKGTADPVVALDLIKGGTLFLTKKVKVRGKSAAGSSKGKSKKKAKMSKKDKEKAKKKASRKRRAHKAAMAAETPATPSEAPAAPVIAVVEVAPATPAPEPATTA